MADISFPEGHDFHQPILLKDNNGAPIDLTGATGLQMVVYRSGSTFLTLTVGNGLTIVSATTGHIRADFSDTQTAGQAGEYNFEVNATLASGDKTLLGAGTLSITESYLGSA